MSTPGTWYVRLIGDPTPRPFTDPHKVLEGVREGEWEPSDEVRGPGETLWRPIEEHPAFADAIAEMGPPPPEQPDETKLDMNPLIDVALVLLIFFILTASYASLRRVLELEPPQSEDQTTKPVEKQDIADRVFKVKVEMVPGSTDKAQITIVDRGVVDIKDLKKELEDVIKNTGRREMQLMVADDVLWGIEALVHDAASGAGVTKIYTPSKKRP